MPVVEVAWAMAPSTLQANGAWPCASSQGWKWSEMDTKSKPACSERTELAIRSLGPCSSVISLYPNFVIVLSREWLWEGKATKGQKVLRVAPVLKVRRVAAAISC